MVSTRKLVILVIDDGYSYPSHLQDPGLCDLNTAVVKAGLNAVKTSEHRMVQELTAQLCCLKIERQKDFELYTHQLESLKEDHVNQLESLKAHHRQVEEYCKRYAQDELHLMRQRLEESKTEQQNQYLLGVETGSRHLTTECNRLKVLADTLQAQLVSVQQERRDVQQQLGTYTEQHQSRVDRAYKDGSEFARKELSERCSLLENELNCRRVEVQHVKTTYSEEISHLQQMVQTATEMAEAKWKQGVEYGKRILSDADRGRCT